MKRKSWSRHCAENERRRTNRPENLRYISAEISELLRLRIDEGKSFQTVAETPGFVRSFHSEDNGRTVCSKDKGKAFKMRVALGLHGEAVRRRFDCISGPSQKLADRTGMHPQYFRRLQPRMLIDRSKGRWWKPVEDHFLMLMFVNEHSIRYMAMVLGRKMNAVRDRILKVINRPKAKSSLLILAEGGKKPKQEPKFEWPSGKLTEKQKKFLRQIIEELRKEIE